MVDLRNSLNNKEISENVEIAEKSCDSNKRQKDRGRPLNLALRLKILTYKQMLQGLSTAFA